MGVDMLSDHIRLETIQWTSIKPFEGVEPVTDGDFEVLREIRDVLRKHNKLGRFGINLIHKHFDIADDEVALETSDEENRTSTIQVLKRAELDGQNSVPTSWRFSDDGASPEIRCHTECKSSGSWSHKTGHRRGP